MQLYNIGLVVKALYRLVEQTRVTRITRITVSSIVRELLIGAMQSTIPIDSSQRDLSIGA